MKGLFVFIVLGALLLIPTTNFAFAQVSDFYWSEITGPGHEIFTADAATQTVSPSLTGGGFDRIRDVEIDPVANKLWWNNWDLGILGPGPQEGIYSSNLDGTGQVQVTSGTESNSVTGFASGMHKIVLDPANGKVFFTRGVAYAQGPLGWGEVSGVNMDGTGYSGINSPGGESWFPSGIELDSANNHLYWGQPGVFTLPGNADGSVNRMLTSGANQMINLTPHVDGEGRSHALDPAKGLLFYSSFSPGAQGMFGGGIFVFDINTGALTNVLNDPTTGIPDIELDTTNMRIYWTDNIRGEIRSAPYDAAGNLGAITTEISNLVNPFGLALAFDEVVVGGEFLQLDTTSLLLAGAQTFSWMIPVVLSVLGIGLFVVSRKSE